MRVRPWPFIATCAFAILAGLPAADALVGWSGPGYYIEDIILKTYAGPFPTKADCQTYIVANAAPEERHAFVCSFYSSREDFDESHP